MGCFVRWHGITETTMILTNITVNYHRNGICGEGFHAVTFDFKEEEGEPSRRMIGIVFEEPYHCAVLDVGLLAGKIGAKFGANSFRGDYFESELRAAIAAHQKEQTDKLTNTRLRTKHSAKKAKS